jgi:phosphate uptake regulator
MHIRNIQRTVGGTYMVTIPKEFVRTLGLDSGRAVKVELEEDRIVILPTEPRQSIVSKVIKTSEFKDPKLLSLAIVNLYIMGYDVAEIVSDEGIMSPAHKKAVREAVENMIGVEIVEDYADRVLLQSLVDPSKFEVDALLQRFTQLSRAVLRDAVKALLSADRALAHDAYERGAELTRLYRLMMRICFQALRSSHVRELVKVRDTPSLVVRIVAVRELGRVAYYCMKSAERVEELGSTEGELAETIAEMAEIVDKMLEQALNSLLRHDLELASSVIDLMDRVRELYAKAFKKIIRRPEREAHVLGLIIRAIRAVAGYGVALADDAILEIFQSRLAAFSAIALAISEVFAVPPMSMVTVFFSAMTCSTAFSTASPYLLSLRYFSIHAPAIIVAVGLTLSIPLYLGTLPWAGSNIAYLSPMFAA